MTASRVVAILTHLEHRGIAAWVDGGWGVDALLERQTREHDDLDLIVRLDQVPQLEAALGELGYAQARGEPPTSIELVDPVGHQVDAHPVSFLESGEAAYRMESGEDWIYEPSALTGTGTIDGHTVKCLTPAAMVRAHTTGYALDAAHQRDVDALCTRFGIPRPSYKRAG